ncbi:MAG: hydrolase 1, exosortase A system-associated [Burkholderiales bacterium]|nr:hydrolase 1, exosortase A system-associated [Burkholderiales bacterium]MDE1925775.1 hydrolase 1, exosortase A system-associated [Burkholderiales bacterium]MDE2160856.1 hydrolase 1, exosortase A system-associated [Burkholderiales bacterium]
MNVTELPIVFECEGSELVGIVHRPEPVAARGLLLIVAGGPQYRAGVNRLQVELARDLAALGVPMMRFDHRGLGDSEGPFRGFEDVGADIGAAIAAFRAQVPGLEEIVLWGGCDAASAILINAWQYPEVTGIALGNPWVHTDATADKVAVDHFGRRILDRDFWAKVLRMEYDPRPALGTLARRARSRCAALVGARPSAGAATPHFIERMCHGLTRYRGDLLLVMSGRSQVSREFDELVASSPAWQQALKSPRRLDRHELPDADQTFSATESRGLLRELLGRWLLADAPKPA